MVDLTGKIVSLERDYRTAKPVLKLMLEEDAVEVAELGASELSIRLSRKSSHRSIDSNAYFHVLCDKLRRKLKISMARCKNMLIFRYGQLDYRDGIIQTIYSNIPVEDMMEQETLHCFPVSVKQVGGDFLTEYRIYRGSHTYNVEEMNELIAGTVEECKEQDIDTATPDELLRMAATWERNLARRDGWKKERASSSTGASSRQS